MLATSKIELSLSALKKNISFLKKQIGNKARFCSVIKGNAYGHGIQFFVPLAEQCGVRNFAVFSAEEALAAHKSKTEQSQIIIMGFIESNELEWAIANKISFYIFHLERLYKALEIARRINIPARIHFELETGLNRTGLEQKDFEELFNILMQNRQFLIVEGVCTHYAGAESVSNYLRIQNQIAKMRELITFFKEHNIVPQYCHSACSAAALTYPQTIMDMVRFGIAQYGYWPSRETQINFFLHLNEDDKKRLFNPFRRVISWKSRIMDIKEVKTGEFVGYGTSYLTSGNQKIASVPVGYFHGFSRRLSNLGWVLVRGRRVRVVGSINMNMMMVDVSRVPGVAVGDEVVLIGRQQQNQLTVSSFADLSNYLNYEVLVRLPSEIPRMVVD